MSEPHVARVAILNETGVKMEQVVLTHRFGDNDAVDVLTWDVVDPGKRSATQNVRFATGFGDMTNYDWWLLTWKTKDGAHEAVEHASAPSVLNMIGDYIIMGGEDVVSSFQGIPALVSTADPVKSGSEFGGALTKLLFGGIARKVSKKAFKEHMLTSSDAYDPAAQRTDPEVIVKAGTDGMTIASVSGTSKADCTSLAIPRALPAV